MTVYACAQLEITDQVRYQRYQREFMGVLTQYQGRLLVADEEPLVVEGSWSYRKLVIIAFPDELAFRTWAESPEYRKISADRAAGTRGVVLLAKGVDQPSHR